MSTIRLVLNGKELTQTQFNEIEKHVIEYFNNIWQEINESIEILRKNNYRMVKSEVCLALIIADAFSRFREIILTGKEEKNNESRFKEWFNDYVFNSSNLIYSKYRNDMKYDSSNIWQLRNSLIHFYGLPTNPTIALGTLDYETAKKFKETVYKSHDGMQVLVVNPLILIKAILHGLLVQLQSFVDIIKGNDDCKKEAYAKGIVKCYEIIQAEGSVFVEAKT
ncbi:MAG: hypothetical protein WCW02_00590 [Candidatus Buchananbacteria bacterium]